MKYLAYIIIVMMLMVYPAPATISQSKVPKYLAIPQAAPVMKLQLPVDTGTRTSLKLISEISDIVDNRPEKRRIIYKYLKGKIDTVYECPPNLRDSFRFFDYTILPKRDTFIIIKRDTVIAKKPLFGGKVRYRPI